MIPATTRRLPQDNSLYEELLSLWHNKAVSKFWCHFKLILALLSDALDEILLGTFLNGLWEEIKAESMKEAMYEILVSLQIVRSSKYERSYV